MTVAELAPHVDRLAICIHRPAGTDPDLRAAIQAMQIPAGSMLVVAARYLTHDGLRPGDVALLSRYQPRRQSTASEEEHVRRGLLLPDHRDGVLAASPEFRALAANVLATQADAARQLWGEPVEAAAVAERLVAGVPREETETLPTFRRQVETRPPTSHAAARLLAAVTELRYLRADAHAAALEAAGLRPKDAIELTKRWRGFGEPLSPADHERRAAIEADTDRRVATALSNSHDVTALLTLVADLPGDDPRPPEDR